MKKKVKSFLYVLLFLFIYATIFKFYNINSNLYNNFNYINYLKSLSTILNDPIFYYLAIDYNQNSFIFYVYEMYIKK